MSETDSSKARDFDIVVFGASGYTGTYISRSLVKHAVGKKCAIAGRSRGNLMKLLGTLRLMHQNDSRCAEFIETIDIIIADVNDPVSLGEMCKRTKILVNSVGPYRLYGKQVVDACVENATHYVDVCGETQVLEEMQLEYFDLAKAKRIYVVGACGFDSIPCDLAIQLLKENFDGDVNSVESYLDIKYPAGNTINLATWKSAILSVSHAAELKQLRKKLKEKIFKKSYEQEYPLKKRLLFKRGSYWCVPFIGSDKSVATRTQLYDYEFNNVRPVQIQTYLCVSSLFSALLIIFMGFIFMLLVKCEFGRNLLEKHPRFFSGGMVSTTVPEREPVEVSDARKETGLFSVVVQGRGWTKTEARGLHTSEPNIRMRSGLCFIVGPYTLTAESAIHAAMVLLTESDKLPAKGGVFTPGALFMKTSLVRRLILTGAAYEYLRFDVPPQ